MQGRAPHHCLRQEDHQGLLRRERRALLLVRSRYLARTDVPSLGCSSGGKQGLKEVQMFPEDYDGVRASLQIATDRFRCLLVPLRSGGCVFFAARTS